MPRRPFFFLFVLVTLLAGCALADEWTKTYQVGDKPALRVETNDAAIEVSRGSSHVISVRVTTEGINIGNGGIHVVDHQSGDTVDLQVHFPHETGFHMSWRGRTARVEVQVPQETAVDLRSGDGHIRVDGTSGAAKVETGDGHIEVRNFNGSVRGRTGDGHMTVEGVFTEVKLETGDGHVDFTARPGSKMSTNWLIHTSDGRVEVRLPQDFAAEIYAHTGDGRISLDFPVTVNGSPEHNRVRGKLNGGGPLFEIGTGDGRISIAKD
jgi:DUF4097 and DUF4098 domain-containing protein YvlB